jgi:uncharacterized phiE125 gp8 family phage protein
MKLELLSGPESEPISLSETKQWLRLDGNAEDELLLALIVSARLTIEAYTRRTLITQSWRMILDAWPEPKGGNDHPTVAIPFAPFQSVTAMRVFDETDTSHSIGSELFYAAAASDGARVFFRALPASPGRALDGIEIDLVAGYGANPADVPEPLRRAILMLVAFWRENRGDGQASQIGISSQAKAIAAPYRRERLT